jgi:hypothetical protein
LEGINGLYVFSLLCYYTTLIAAATKKKPIGDDVDRQFTIIINSASTAAPIGLPPKMAEFCHTPNRLLLGRQCRRALLWLYFNSSATGRSAVGGRSEMKIATLRLLEGINGLYVFPLLCYYATLTAAATKTKLIGNDDDRRFTIIVNSASTAAPIGLPPKMA